MKISEQAVFVYMITYGASDHFVYSFKLYGYQQAIRERLGSMCMPLLGFKA